MPEARAGPESKAHRITLIGIDAIGGYLTKINVTSATDLQ
jgi:hypothetical protein